MRLQDQANSPVGAALAKSQLAIVEAKLATAQAQLAQLDRRIELGMGTSDVMDKKAQVSVDIAQLKADVARLTALATAPPQAQTGTVPPAPPRVPVYDRFDPAVVLAMAFGLLLCIVLPSSIAVARHIWRRAPRTAVEPTLLMARLDRIEQAVDSIALEVERISEGQRYVTKLLAEQSAKPLLERQSS